jgi:2-polyprenyl-3-methyl-5-hydroxy-6-metoxy-1,4-benzoquinol methylase
MVRQIDNLRNEAKAFDGVYKERFKRMESILLDDDRIEDYFYKNPWRYGFSRRYAFNRIIEQFNRVIPQKPGLSILEIGCGNGWFSINANISNKNKWDCFDVSLGAITTSRLYAKRYQSTNAYRVASLENFRSRKKYDVIACVNTLHHIRDLTDFSKTINTYLKHDGLIFIHDVSPDYFGMRNASYVLTIQLLLSLTGQFYQSDTPGNDFQKNIGRIIQEWQNETEDVKQSVNDHVRGTDDILAFLNRSFRKIHYSANAGGILMRLLGGIRGENSEAIGNMLINLENYLLEQQLISPYTYCFVAKQLP